MNTSNLMKKSTHLAFTFLLGTFVVLGLSACAEGQTGGDADTAMTDADTAMTDGGMNGGMAGGGMAGDSSVTVQGTINTLQQGLTSIPVNAAVQNINGWQTRLEGNSQLSDVNDSLEELKSQLQANQIDGQAVGETLTNLGDQTSQAAQSASGAAMTRLQTLGQTLTQAGNGLTGGGM